MAEIYISLGDHDLDLDLAQHIERQLTQLGHDITILNPSNMEFLSMEHRMRSMEAADVLILLFSGDWAESATLLSDLAIALSAEKSSERVIVIPIVLDDIALPDVLKNTPSITATTRDTDKISTQVSVIVARHLVERAERERKEKQVHERIESNSAIFIKKAMASLEQRERQNRLLGIVWYSFGLVTLLCGIGASLFELPLLINHEVRIPMRAAQEPWVIFAYTSLKNLIVIGLLIAGSKYSYILGKSFMQESLKSAERIHAISFGEFYLNAYGDKAEWTEMKEVFQHWNITSTSAFSETDPSQYDPKILETIADVLKSALPKKE
jgi:hypothetical protein